MSHNRVLYLDPFSGISGDMLVGALLDLGVSLDVLRQELAKLKLSGYQLSATKVRRGAIAATKFDVALETHGEHAHATGGAAHPHAGHTHGRKFAQIKTLLEESALTPRVKADAVRTFQKLAAAEGKIHGVPPEEVGFHEVGALDSIIDIVGACAGLEALRIDAVRCGPVALGGGGFVQCAHGPLPLPAPAALELMKGIPIRETALEEELTTPTGAAIVAALATSFGPLPALTIENIGYGAGAREGHGTPNVLRAVAGTAAAESTLDDASSDTVLELQTNLDNATPEVLGYLSGKLLELGALDVFFTPIQMKKSRPGTLVTVLAEPAALDLMAETIFKESPAFGLRYQTLPRLKLARRMVTVQTRYGAVRVKVGAWRGAEISVHPEYEDCRKLAQERGVPLHTVIDAAQAAFSGQ